MQTIINSKITVWTSSVTVTPVNNQFRHWVFCNDSANTIYLSIGADAVVWEGMRLNANGWTFDINLTNPIKGDVHAIATWAGSNLSFITITG